MSTQFDESAIAVRYLLGQLSEQEEKTFEDSFFADDEVFEDLKISEAEVIDAYVANELTDRQRKHLEQRLAASLRLQQRVAFARTFAQSRAAGKPVQHRQSHDELTPEPWWRRVFAVPLVGNLTPVGAFAALLIVIALGAVVLQSIRLRSESRRLEAERAELARDRDELASLAATERDRASSELRAAQQRYERAEELVKSLQQDGRPTPRKQPSTFASLMLLPGSARSPGESNDLVIPQGATEVRLSLVLLRADYRSYQVIISGPANKQIQRTGLKASSRKTITLSLPATSLPPGQYTVKVNGVAAHAKLELVNDYTFRIVPK